MDGVSIEKSDIRLLSIMILEKLYSLEYKGGPETKNFLKAHFSQLLNIKKGKEDFDQEINAIKGLLL